MCRTLRMIPGPPLLWIARVGQALRRGQHLPGLLALFMACGSGLACTGRSGFRLHIDTTGTGGNAGTGGAGNAGTGGATTAGTATGGAGGDTIAAIDAAQLDAWPDVGSTTSAGGISDGGSDSAVGGSPGKGGSGAGASTATGGRSGTGGTTSGTGGTADAATSSDGGTSPDANRDVGAATGGAGTGGAATGGAPTGGAATGGAPTGGAATGGAPTGGAATGGAATGGAPTGGAATGGAATGGAPTGGAATGGAATGGAATGGSAAGGSSTVEKKGMTWALRAHDSTLGTDFVGCDGCDAFAGDTLCSEAHPILCIDKHGYSDPGIPNTDYYYYGWSGGDVAVTSPLYGTLLTSLSVADAICRDELGPSWQMAEFHDSGGAWNFYAFGNLPSGQRFWTYINDQPGALCWF
jgi:hypothetical protein